MYIYYSLWILAIEMNNPPPIFIIQCIKKEEGSRPHDRKSVVLYRKLSIYLWHYAAAAAPVSDSVVSQQQWFSPHIDCIMKNLFII